MSLLQQKQVLQPTDRRRVLRRKRRRCEAQKEAVAETCYSLSLSLSLSLFGELLYLNLLVVCIGSTRLVNLFVQFGNPSLAEGLKGSS